MGRQERVENRESRHRVFNKYFNMTVKELKELLGNARDDMRVLVIVEDHSKPGMFAFAEACTCDTGISQLGEVKGNGDEGEEVFLVLPHGSGVSEDDIESGKAIVPDLN